MHMGTCTSIQWWDEYTSKHFLSSFSPFLPSSPNPLSFSPLSPSLPGFHTGTQEVVLWLDAAMSANSSCYYSQEDSVGQKVSPTLHASSLLHCLSCIGREAEITCTSIIHTLVLHVTWGAAITSCMAMWLHLSIHIHSLFGWTVVVICLVRNGGQERDTCSTFQ